MAGFIPFLDKENSSQTQILRAGATGLAPVGKNFSAQPGLGGLENIRKALGNLNVNPINQKPGKGLGGVSKIPVRNFQPNRLQQKPVRPKEQPAQLDALQYPEVQDDDVQYPEIEYMPQVEEEDTYEDIWPIEERAESHIANMLSWRPTSLYPHRPDYDSDDSLVDFSDHDSADLHFYVKDDTVEDIELVWEEEVTLAPLPPLDLDGMQLPSLDGVPSDCFDDLAISHS